MKKRLRLFTHPLTRMAAILLTAAAATAAEPPTVEVSALQDIYPSGLSISPNNTFGGSMNGVSFQQDAIITYKGWQYVGILTGERLPAIARRQLGTDIWETLIIPGYFIFSNDRHNIMSVGICPNDGTIHPGDQENIAFIGLGNVVQVWVFGWIDLPPVFAQPGEDQGLDCGLIFVPERENFY